MVKLLIFAHRGEAQAFFNEWELLPVSFFFTGLFKNKDHYLLITGEGPKEASEKTVAVLAAFKSEISEVINIGIAGSLNSKLRVGDCVWIRSSYAQNAKACEFKSYTTNNHNNIDCITAYSRITTSEDKKFLSSFADIVDRELWAIASASHLFKIELSALKLISDESDSVDICPLTNAGVQASFDPELEQDFIQLSIAIRSTKDQKKLILALEQFNYQKIKDIFKGNLGDDV